MGILWKWKGRESGIRSNRRATDSVIRIAIGVVTFGIVMAVPVLAFGSVEGSLVAVQAKLVGTLLPLAAICGLAFAGMSFVMGHANARAHLVWAIVGAVVGFGAESIVSLIRSVIQ